MTIIFITVIINNTNGKRGGQQQHPADRTTTPIFTSSIINSNYQSYGRATATAAAAKDAATATAKELTK